MYERSAIVLEKYFNELFSFNKKINLKTIYKDYKDSISQVQKYQQILEEEDKLINEFDDIANQIRRIQKEQNRIYQNNIKDEEEREQLFNNLEDNPEKTGKKLNKIAQSISERNDKQKELGEEFEKVLTQFNNKQTERNIYAKNKRIEETTYVQLIEKAKKDIDEIDEDVIKLLKNFINSSDENEEQEIEEIMLDNGKDERVSFNKDVINHAAKIRNEIAKKEAECYITIYDKMKKLLTELDDDDVKIDRHKKILRDTSVKLSFLKAQKMYIVSFLDNERMTAINGLNVHQKLMEDACEKFELDIQQINNLYSLLLKEITGRATKKAYTELYNKEYLRSIEDKEKSFEREVDNIQIHTGTIINSNYWRINEIRNIYKVFEDEVVNKFERDLSEFMPEEVIEIEEYENPEEDIDEADIEEVVQKQEEAISDMEMDDIFKTTVDDDIVEYFDDFDEDDGEYEFYEDEEIEDDSVEEQYEDEEDFEHNDEEYEDNEEDKYDEDEYYDDENEYYEEEYYDDEDEYDEDEYYDDENEYDEDEYYDDEDDYEYDEEELEQEDSKTEVEDKSNKKERKKGKGLFNKFF